MHYLPFLSRGWGGGAFSVGHPSVGHGFVYPCVCLSMLCKHLSVFVRVCGDVLVCLCDIFNRCASAEEQIWAPLVRDATL